MAAITSKLSLGTPAFVPLGPVKEVSHLNALHTTTDTEGDKEGSESESEEYTKRVQRRRKASERRKSSVSSRRGSDIEENKEGDSRRNSLAGNVTDRSRQSPAFGNITDRGRRKSVVGSNIERKRRDSSVGSVTDRSRQGSVIGNVTNRSRRSSGFGNVTDRSNLDGSISKSKLGRRHSMLESVISGLQQISGIPALSRFRSNSKSNEDGFDDGITSPNPDEVFYPRRQYDFPRRRRISSVCSDDLPIVTDHEMRKIKMMQTLQSMGYPHRPKKNHGYNEISDEIRVLESLALRKRTSLNTRLLEGTKITRLTKHQHIATSRSDDGGTRNRRRTSSLNRLSRRSSRSTDRSGQPTPDAISDNEITNDHKEKLHKVMGLWNKPDEAKPFAGLRSRGSLSSVDLASQSIGIFRRKLKKKGKLHRKFARLAKFLVILFRAWRIHSQSVNEMLSMYEPMDALAKFESTEELLFDVSAFRASKDGPISKKTRKILEKPPKERSEDDLHYLQIALRNYKSIREYPVHMQRLISEKCWYEKFGPKRVVVREGRIPMAFYFILSGSAIVTAMDPANGRVKTVMFLNRGDSFGEHAIMTRSLRQTTVLTRENIELLVMSDADFVDIFMSGGLRDPKDPFLRSLDILEDWPIELLAENPSSAIFSYFKRGTVLVNDSQNNEWLFIIKSGSCSLLKKLKDVSYSKPKPKLKRKKTWKEELEDMAQMGGKLTHEEQIELLHHQEIRRLEEENVTLRFYALPEINVATNAAYSELRQMHADFVNQNTLTRALGALQDMAEDAGSVAGSVLTMSEQHHPAHRKMSLIDLGELVGKNSLLAKSERSHQDTPSKDQMEATETPDDDRTTSYGQKHVTIKVPSASTIARVKAANRPVERSPRFVNVRTLTKGQHFGLEDLLFKDQGCLSLISNGVEVIMINKKLYLDNLDTNRRIQLIDKVYPYPTDDDLQQDLDHYMYWEFHRKQTFENSLRHKKITKIKPHDSRAILEVPPLI